LTSLAIIAILYNPHYYLIIMTNFLRNFDKVSIDSNVYNISTAEECIKIIFVIP